MNKDDDTSTDDQSKSDSGESMNSKSDDTQKKSKSKKHKKKNSQHKTKRKEKKYEKKKGKKKKKDKDREKTRKRKHKKGHRKEPKDTSDESNGNIGPDMPSNLPDQSRNFAPMSLEQWEAKQKDVRRVFDEETGRYRLVRGTGEILEEIVSKDRHKEINKQATMGDGAYFQSVLSKK